MRTTANWMIVGTAGAAMAAMVWAGSATAQLLGKEASECEIAASLGVQKEDCLSAAPKPGVRTRGLAIGNIDQMPAPPQPAQPAPAASATAAVPPPPAPAAATTAAVPPPPAPAPAPAPAPIEPAVVASPPPAPAVPAAPAPQPAVTRAEPQEFRAAFQINFEFGSDRLTAEAMQILDRVGSVMGAGSAAQVRFRIVGHTDSVGRSSYNQSLSERRAASVKRYLMDRHSVAAWRLESLGMGESQPLNRADPADGINRRVEIINIGA